MLISIIIPAYNCEKFLSSCLGSVEAQTFRDFELIVVDDGSEDSSGIIADDYAAEHDNARVLHGDNVGPLLARRRGLLNAQGKYVVFLDSDDTLHKDALWRVSSEIDTSNADVISFRYARDETLRNASDAPVLQPGLYDGTSYGDVKRVTLGGRFNNLWGKAIRLGCFDLDADYKSYARLMMAEDLFQLLPIIDNSKTLARMDDILYFYRPNDASSTAAYQHDYLEDIERVANRLVAYGEAWDLQTEALMGALQLYVNLAHMLSDSEQMMARDEAILELQLVKGSLLDISPKAVQTIGAMRFDNRRCLQAVLKEDLFGIRRWTKVFHAGRRFLGRGE